MSRSNLAYSLDFGRRMRERDADRAVSQPCETGQAHDGARSPSLKKPDAHQMAIDADAMCAAMRNTSRPQ